MTLEPGVFLVDQRYTADSPGQVRELPDMPLLTHKLIYLMAALPSAFAFAAPAAEQDAFFERLVARCGNTYTGAAVFPAEPGEVWKDRILVARIETCEAAEVRMPFTVGGDRSRTWILRRVDGGLELKHDHRHEDGTPDDVTNYGGVTRKAGTPLVQSFPADETTAELIPEAATNEWFLSFSEDGSELTYYLERHGKPRFKAVLTRD
jgi:hypothetical protein